VVESEANDCVEGYMLENDDWKYDIMPEIMDGKNVADFVDPEIHARLEALEKEEEELIANGYYDSGDDLVVCVVPVLIS
jgi:nucleolar GTP-binding protein